MKRIFILTILLAGYIAAVGQSDAISKYFDKYMDDENFTMVYVSPKMFNLVAKLDIDDIDEETKELIKSIKGLRILTTDIDPQTYYNEAVANFNISEYEKLMEVRDEAERVHFLVKSGTEEKIEELLLLVGGGSEFVMLSFIGNIDLDKISKLANSMDIQGAEHLDKLEQKEEK